MINTIYEAPNPIRQITLTQPVTLAQNGPRLYSAKSSYQVEFVFSAHPMNIIPTYHEITAPKIIRKDPYIIPEI